MNLSNGVLRDKRVFHVDSPDWIEKYNHQSTLSLVFDHFDAYICCCSGNGMWGYQRLAPRWSKTGSGRSSSEVENLRLDCCPFCIIHNSTVRTFKYFIIL